MMNGRGKSDSAIVAGKPTNKAGQLAAESVEPSAEAKGNASQQSTRRAQDRERVSQALERIRQVARQRKKERFTSLFHHISVELLRVAFLALKRDAAPGVDGLTWQDYEADLDRKIEDLHARVHRGAYRALPSRRHYIPKADGQQRPLAIAALDATATASLNPRTGALVEASCYRLLCIPRSASQHLVTRHVPFSDHSGLAPLAKAAQSEGRHDLETDHEAGE